MASTTVTASSFLGGAAAASPKEPPANVRRQVVLTRASKTTEGEKTVSNADANSREGRSTLRRDLMLAAAAAAACSIAKAAMADEPKPGTPEAKKKYAPICVTMPTARICHK